MLLCEDSYKCSTPSHLLSEWKLGMTSSWLPSLRPTSGQLCMLQDSEMTLFVSVY